MLISDLAGRSNIVMKARELGFDVTNATPQLREMLTRIKDLEHQGYEFESADGSLALVIRRALTDTPPPFVVDAYHVSVRRDGDISIVRGDRESPRRQRIANTASPKATVRSTRWTPRCAPRSAATTSSSHDVQLTDYKVRIIDSHSGTAARTRVLIESERRHR